MRAGQIDSGDSGQATVIALQGEHDLSTAPELRQAFNAAFDRDRPVVVDMSVAEFIDSSIVAVLVECGKALEDAPPRVAIYLPADASPAVRRVLELTGLASHMQVDEALEGAIRAVSGGQ